MISNARIFFAGVATTFLILGIGFAGGMMLAASALHDRPAQMRASSESSPAVKVILPVTAEPSLQVPPAAQTPEAPPQVQPVKEVELPIKPAENADAKQDARQSKQDERQLKAERRKQAERKARRIAAARARQQVEPEKGQQPGLMAFGNDGLRLFGN
jgi:type IV secretory pathway VirB10-like protein